MRKGDGVNIKDKFLGYVDTDSTTLPREVSLLDDETKSIVWEILEGSKTDYIRLRPVGNEGKFLMYDTSDDTTSANHKFVIQDIKNMTGLTYKCSYQSMDILLSVDTIEDTYTKCSLT